MALRRSKMLLALFVSLVLGVCCSWATTTAEDPRLGHLKRIYEDCQQSADVWKCIKVKGLKWAQKLLKANRQQQQVEVMGGIDVVQVRNVSRSARTMSADSMDEDQLQQLDNERVNDLLYDAAYNFLDTHSININLPKMVDEARGRKKKNRYAGPFLAALAVKGVIMAMTYKTIAVIAGTALLVGKMALVLAAILGLKKLVSSEKEKTTVEIVKHPTHSTSHTHSSSFEEAEGHYRRSVPTDEEMMILDNINRNSYYHH